MDTQKIKVGIIGLGRMGAKYLKAFMADPDTWQVAYVCDVNAATRDLARRVVPTAQVVDTDEPIFADPQVQAVVLCTLADQRLSQVQKAVRHGKHIITEKPIADTLEREWEVVRLAESAGLLATVNLYQRNSMYNSVMRDYIASGEIGELAIVRICHMTPGLAPGEGHEHEGPAFHDCGMHYVDLARWYAQSDYATWSAQGLRMWDYKDPWWVQVHGTFDNGIVFDITQGFVYGQLSERQTHNSYIDLIGTKGIARMTHDFKTATVELRGEHSTRIEQIPYGDKNIDVLCRRFAESLRRGALSDGLPTLRDAANASDYAWRFFHDTTQHRLPSIGNERTLEQIRERRATMTEGYGLLHRRHADLEL